MQKITYKGITASNYKELCVNLGLDYNKFYYRRGKYPNRDLEYWLHGDSIEYNGTKYQSYKDICTELNVSYNVFRWRKKHHPERGLNYWITGEIELIENPIIYGDVIASSYRNLCGKLGINYKSFYNRKKRHPDKNLDFWLYGKKSKL